MEIQKRQSIVKRIIQVIISSVVLLTVGIASFFFWINLNLKQLNQQTNEYNQLRLEIEKIQSQFDSQAKDRKNLFLRGHKEKDLKKYQKRVAERSQRIYEMIQKAIEHSIANPYAEKLQTFVKDHKALMLAYEDGVKLFIETQDASKGDRSVRGKGGKTSEILGEVIQQIQQDTDLVVSQHAKDTQNLLVIAWLIITLISIIVLSLVTYSLVKPIRRIIVFSAFLKDAAKEDTCDAYETKDNDEIGDMIHSFNEYERTIDDYRKNLEQKVADRTKELSQANDRIQELNAELKGENRRMSAELNVAKELQMMVLPSNQELKETKQFERIDVAGFMSPADEVGGDYYDILPLPNDGILIGIGDVTGHGLSSGVLMLMAQTAIRTLSADELGMEEFLNRVNYVIYQNAQRIDATKNMTMALIFAYQNKYTIVGQHESVIICRQSGEIEEIETISLGFYVGMEPDISDFTNTRSFQMEKGDVMVLYSDGVTEAINPQREEFGTENLVKFVQKYHQSNAQEIIDGIHQSLLDYIGDAKIYDDISLVAIKQN